MTLVKIFCSCCSCQFYLLLGRPLLLLSCSFCWCYTKQLFDHTGKNLVAIDVSFVLLLSCSFHWCRTKQIFDHPGKKLFIVVDVVVSFVFLLGRPLLLRIKSASLFLLLLCVPLKICMFVICIVRVQYKRPVLHTKQDARHSPDADQWGGFGAMLWLHHHRHHPHTATRWLRQHARGGQETWQLIWVWGLCGWGGVG